MRCARRGQIRLKAQNELRARAKEHARMLREKKLSEETQERAIAQAQLNASVRVRPRPRPRPGVLLFQAGEFR